MIYTSCKVCGSSTEDFLPQFELLKCTNCNSIFYKHQLDSAYVKDLYDKLYNEQEDYSEFKRQAQKLQNGEQPHLGYNKSKVLNSLIDKGCTNFMEIGAGVGIVGNYLQKKVLKYDGIELDAEAARLAQSVGVNIKNDSFHELSKYSAKDAMISFEVLEHIDDLGLCYKLMHDVLKPGGYLGFSVPNFKNYYNQRKEVQEKYLGQVGPPVHINMFTVESLAKVLPTFGFKVLHLRARPYPSLIWKSKATYKKLLQSLMGNYHGSTILCIAQRID